MDDSMQAIVLKMETGARDAHLSRRVALGVASVVVLALLAVFSVLFPAGWVATLVIAPVYCAACIYLVDGVKAYRLRRYLGTYAALCQTFAGERRINMHAVSMRMGVSVYTLTNMVFALIREDVLPATCFDAVRKEFVLADDAMPPPQVRAHNAALMDSGRQPTLMPYGLALLCCLGCMAYLHFGSVVVPLAVAAVFFMKIRKAFIPVYYFHETLNLSLGTEAEGSLADRIGPAIGRIVREDVQEADEPAAGTSVQALRDALSRLADCIENESVRDAARLISDAVADVCDLCDGSAETSGDMRQLTHQYLPMCVRLLSDYSAMEVYRHKGQRVHEVMREIEESMSQIAEAIVKALDDARSRRLMHTSVELEVLKVLLWEDGEGTQGGRSPNA